MAIVMMLKTSHIIHANPRLHYVKLSKHCSMVNIFLVHHFSLFCVCAHTSHYHPCAVACVYSIFINSYFYSKPC